MNLLVPCYKLTRYSSLLIAGLALFTSVWCQPDIGNIKFSNLSIKDGLSQSSPNCIFQDSKGIMWIGTEDGLNKYDGYSFKVYKPMADNPFSISNSRILCIAEDSATNLWIGTNGGGLNKYDRKNDRFLKVVLGRNSVGVDIVKSIVSFGKDQIWVGTDDGLFGVETTTDKGFNLADVFAELEILEYGSVNALLADENVIWIASNKGLFSFNTKSRSLPVNLKDNIVTALLKDQSNNIIAGTEDGVYVFDKTGLLSKINLPNYNSNRGHIIKAIAQDNNGKIWIGTFGSGLYIGSIQTGDFVNLIYNYLNPYSIRNNEVLSICKDYSGLIWVGTNGIDIYRSQKEKFVLYDYVPFSNEGLIFRNIHPIYEDHEGVLWVGSKTDGLHILDRKNKRYSRWIRTDENKNGLSSSRIRAIKEYPRGTLWIGTEDAGIDKVILGPDRRPVKFTNYRYNAEDPNSLTSNRIYSLFFDSQGILWIGTDNGLTVMDVETGKCKRYIPEKGNEWSISHTTVYAIFNDSRNNIWLATDMGINRYVPEKDGFKHYVHNDSIENSIIYNEILCFHEDAAGNLWIGTYGKGFDKFDPVKENFTHFSRIPEVETAVVYGILQDDSGLLWMSTNNGILKFNPRNNKVQQFDIDDGLQSNEFNGTSYFKSNTGEMFFGGQFGFNSFFPINVELNVVSPKVILSDLQVNAVSIQPGKDSPIQTHINEAEEIILNHNQNNITLFFSALHFENSNRNQYRYKLEGFDKDWIDAGNKRFATYTNLPYRSFRFRVIASNSDGIWNEKGVSVKIKVKPPFWATIWFRIAVILVTISVLYLIIQRRKTNDERQKKIIEEKFKASSKELEEARTQLEEQHAEIVIQKRELISRQKDQENLLWFNQGLGNFSGLISKYRDDMVMLCKEFIHNLTDYVEAQQGGVFLLNNENENEAFIELVACHCYDIGRQHQRFSEGEGYIGTCYRDKKFLEIDNLSADYSTFNSGLGCIPIKHLVLAPLVVNDQCIGVVELGSFKKIKGYKISFIEKLLETFSGVIMTEYSNKKLKKLIEQSTRQARDLAENEEKMRKSMEEILAAHEESSRREDELIKLAEESATREEMLNQEIEVLRGKINQLTGETSLN